MRTPDDGEEMSMLISKYTPADAPAVKKMLPGLEGYPSRSTSKIRYQGWSGETWLTFNEVCNIFADERYTLTVRIGANRTDLA